MEKRLTVIVCFFNRAPFLAECLNSVAAELSTVRDELILVDDGSTDGGIGDWNEFPFRLHRSSLRQGVSASRNIGISQSTGQFVAFFDSDDIAQPGAFSKRIEFLTLHPEAAVVSGWVSDVIDEKGQRLGNYAELLPLVRRAPPFTLTLADLTSQLLYPLHTWMFLFRREVFVRVGTFSTWLGCGEDHDLILRVLGQTGIPVIPVPVAHYRIHRDNLSVTRTESRIGPSRSALASFSLIYGNLAIGQTMEESIGE